VALLVHLRHPFPRQPLLATQVQLVDKAFKSRHICELVWPTAPMNMLLLSLARLGSGICALSTIEAEESWTGLLVFARNCCLATSSLSIKWKLDTKQTSKLIGVRASATLQSIKNIQGTVGICPSGATPNTKLQHSVDQCGCTTYLPLDSDNLDTDFSMTLPSRRAHPTTLRVDEDLALPWSPIGTHPCRCFLFLVDICNGTCEARPLMAA
jgi:hypothetical protein